MQLDEYLKRHAMTKIAFAHASKISLDAIYRYLSGDIPSLIYQEKIEQVTSGKVTKKDWITWKFQKEQKK